VQTKVTNFILVSIDQLCTLLYKKLVESHRLSKKRALSKRVWQLLFGCGDYL